MPPPTLGGAGADGLAPATGGLGLVATGGGGFDASELDGREFAGELSFVSDVDFFHGAADPLAAAIPGKTEIGLALGFAVLAAGVGLEAAETGGTFRGGGGGAGGAAGSGATSSR